MVCVFCKTPYDYEGRLAVSELKIAGEPGRLECKACGAMWQTLLTGDKRLMLFDLSFYVPKEVSAEMRKHPTLEASNAATRAKRGT